MEQPWATGRDPGGSPGHRGPVVLQVSQSCFYPLQGKTGGGGSGTSAPHPLGACWVVAWFSGLSQPCHF